LDGARYAAGFAGVALIAVATGAAGVEVRRQLLPGVAGSLARLAEAVVAIAVVMLTATVVGAFGALDPIPLALCCLAAAAAVWWLARRSEAPAVGPPTPPPSPDRLLTAAAVAGAGMVVAQWTKATLSALDTGMKYYDSLSYHLPAAARFAQDGSIFQMPLTTEDPLTAVHPHSSELVDAVGMVAFDGDFATVLVNMGWLTLALLAAWCVGRPWGRQPLTLLAICIVVSTPLYPGTQAGEGGNDIMALALLLAAVALVLNAGDRRGGVILAGLAAGLSLGTRLTSIPAAVGLAGGLALTRGRAARRLAVLFAGTAAAAGGFWYLRNLFLAGNPLPLLHLGPLPATDTLYQKGDNTAALVGYLGDSDVMANRVRPGLETALGDGWLALLALYLAGGAGALATLTGRARMIGGLALALGIVFLFTPGSAAAGGNLFYVNLRYFYPALALGLVVFPLVSVLATGWRRWPLAAGLLALLLVTALSPGRPSAELAGGDVRRVAIGAAVVAAALLAPRVAARLPRPALAGALVAALVLAGIAGWRTERRWENGRFSDPYASNWQAEAKLWRWTRGLPDSRIGFAGLQMNYPLVGDRLANTVRPVGVKGPHGNFDAARDCRAWRRALNAGRYDYVVTAPRDFPDEPTRGEPPSSLWTRGAGGARPVFSDPASRIVVYRLVGPLPLESCS
jgi:hypothetical protein